MVNDITIKDRVMSSTSDISHQIDKLKNILKKPVNDKKINNAMDDENKNIKDNDGIYFRYSIHKPTKTIVVKIIDSKTNKVVDEIPPEKILDMIAGLWKIAGLFIDKKM